MALENDTQLSKKLSYLLRHGAVEEGISINPDGFVAVQAILDHPKYRKIFDFAALERLVRNDNKKRYELRQSASGEGYEIRANQGHSLKEVLADECLQLIEEPNEIPMAVHGTFFKNWQSIKTQGLKHMRRNHVHFAISDQANIVSGIRSNSQVLIYLNVPKVIEDGQMKLYRSTNNVVLCSGINGCIPPKYFQKVIEKKSQKRLDI